MGNTMLKLNTTEFLRGEIEMKKIYQAREIEPDKWEKKTKWVITKDEIICTAILVLVLGWFVIRIIIG